VAGALIACTGGGDGASDREEDGAPSGRSPIEVVNEAAWPMHPIDGRFRGANGLSGADVDGDGDRDYVTNYEFDQRWVVALHPGDDPGLRRSWPTVEIWAPEPLAQGNGKNPESSALGDFDGDGNVDAAGAHGFSDILAFEGSAPGVHLVWGPDPDRASDPDAWEDAGWVPTTVDVGHPHWVFPHDVNGDGLLDVTVGGRRHGGGGGYDSPDSPNGNGTLTGIGWLEAPKDRSRRRDLARWRFHRIDADVASGHGFVFADVDGDGDDDVVDATADFDTPEEAEDVAWYENPGNGTEAQRGEWRRRVLFTSSDFFAKPSVAVGDIDGDDRADIVTQTRDEVLLFHNMGGTPVEFETVRVPKPEPIAWLGRTIRLADVDRDGDLDVVGMLIHDGGDLPADKASVFVLLNEGEPFAGDGWRLLPVKWGPDVTMLIPGFGEKWDQADVVDVDGDGDLDIVANCEEWWVEDQGEVTPFFAPGLATSSVAVVWFENRLGEPPPQYAETRGSAVVEAEDPTQILDSTWVERAPVVGDDDARAALQAHNSRVAESGEVLEPLAGSGVAYRVVVEGGTYSLWARLFEPADFGPDLGGDRSDSVWLVVDDRPPVVLGDTPGGAGDTWSWVAAGAPVDLEPGEHTVRLVVRERGIAVDRLLLTTDARLRPEGSGPEPAPAEPKE
jgi:hypothetical protein